MLDPAVERDVRRSAQALLGGDVALVPCRGGRNSRVYRIESTTGTIALKLYPDDGRERAAREFGATSLFAAAGVGRVPRPLAIDSARRTAAYSWIDGEPVADFTLRDIDALADFASELHVLRTSPLAHGLPDATEACFDDRCVIDQIQLRFHRLKMVEGHTALHQFLHERVAPVLERERRRVSAALPSAARARRTLSPSDFGFHNALRTGPSALAFLDFEYFGWDDPVKLVADVCWHPGMALGAELRAHFVARALDIYRNDANFRKRLNDAYVLYGLRWCLIVLNEFLPAFWERRVAAGLAEPALAVLQQQFLKSRALLDRVVAFLEGDSL